jgi:hypothetical protein
MRERDVAGEREEGCCEGNIEQARVKESERE